MFCIERTKRTVIFGCWLKAGKFYGAERYPLVLTNKKFAMQMKFAKSHFEVNKKVFVPFVCIKK